eukprot:gnl/Spiro4/4544_TR2265_c0_g1_i2.p1 gnl/Spiro4/4544_TR2265_c0_g1~~gnl/Spiro4/4544_TR2265_c0_g1_i2.p1  ORF type:complete len:328 (+),score=55.78 gnl/Spiro4/4544_TR2265_c0_g1_i2:1314-2297(+)
MSLSFADMKKSRGQNTLKLAQEMQKAKSGNKFEEDKRYWYPDVDKTGNGYAVIRFLPAPKGEELPYVRLWRHSFKGPTGKWYVNNSLTTLGQNDPVGEYNTELWARDEDKESPFKKQARDQKRKLEYHANILVLVDKLHPENEGQVKLFRFGPKIFEKLADAMNPKYDDEKPLNPFDFWEGADFKVKTTTVAEYRNYDKSEFAASSVLYDNDEAKLEKVWSECHSLAAIVAPEKFKTYEQLKAALEAAVPGSTTGGKVLARPTQSRKQEDAPDNEDGEDETDRQVEEKKEQRSSAAKSSTPSPFKGDDDEEDEDKDLAYYQSLVNKR